MGRYSAEDRECEAGSTVEAKTLYIIFPVFATIRRKAGIKSSSNHPQ